jgi:hypothetical protein
VSRGRVVAGSKQIGQGEPLFSLSLSLSLSDALPILLLLILRPAL